MVHQLGPAGLRGGQRRGARVREERHRRVAEADFREDRAHPCGGLGHQRGVGGDAHREDDRAPGAEPLRGGRGGLDGGSDTGDHHLARGVAVGHAERAVGGAGRDEVVESFVGEADDRGHRARVPFTRCLHQAPALPHQADPVGEGDDARGDHGRVLAHRVAGGECGGEGGPAGGRAPVLEGAQECDGGREEGRLGVDREVEGLGRAFPGEARERLAEGLVGGREHRRGGRRHVCEGAAHADGLRALAGEDERERGHRAPRGCRARASCREHAAGSGPGSVERTGPGRDARARARCTGRVRPNGACSRESRATLHHSAPPATLRTWPISLRSTPRVRAPPVRDPRVRFRPTRARRAPPARGPTARARTGRA